MPRLLSLDALRGVAVILMMEQHLGVWLPRRSGLTQGPLYMALNGLGGLAAPTLRCGSNAPVTSRREAGSCASAAPR